MIFSFDSFRLNTDTRELQCDDTLVVMEPQTFTLLETLIAHHDTVLTKDDLMEAVWRGRLTSDAAIAHQIKQARKALGDDGRAQRYIKTLHGVGYRFVGQLRTGNIQTGDSSNELGDRQLEDNAGSDARPVILVRGFESPNQQPDIFASGLTHDVISGLSRVRWLKVISWASVLQLQQESQGLIRSLTAADYCLTGQVIPSQSNLDLSLELTNLHDQSIVWAERISTSAGEVNELRESAVQQVISKLELQISAAEAAKAQYVQTDNLDAWSNYHLGMLHMYRFNAEDNRAAVACFERAIEQQPEFARAHAGLSFASFQSVFNRYSVTDDDSLRALTAESAERSVQLDGMDPMANFVMGRSYWLSGDIESSLPWLERALQINNNFAQAHYSRGLASVLLDSAAISESDGHSDASSAITLSPLDPFTYGFYGLQALAHLRDGNLTEAVFWANRAARQPNAVPTMDFIAAAVCSIAGDQPRGLAWAERARNRSGNADSRHFFSALPFYEGPVRAQLQQAFDTLALAPKG